ncbi:MAG: hypothetical protein DRP64_20450 [Verrucomicrobia bacterium]|nr:MAG: hypothetical protein DRP64_20450 [Verrucomicrobiota bacterium]
MAKKKAAKKRKKGSLKRNIWAGLLIALILYIGIHILSRTDGFRSMVADKISNGTRLPVALESCGTTPLLGLHLKGLDFYGVKMPDVRVRFNWFAGLSKDKPLVSQLHIQRLEVKLQRIPETGNWEPLVLHGLGSKLGAVLGLNPIHVRADDSLPKFPAYVINEKTLLQLRRAKVIWHDEQNRELAYIADLDTRIKVVAFSDRKALQTRLKCGHIKLASGRLLRDFQIEAVKIDGYKPTLILSMSDSDGEYEGFQTETLWQDLNLHLDSLSEL